MRILIVANKRTRNLMIVAIMVCIVCFGVYQTGKQLNLPDSNELQNPVLVSKQFVESSWVSSVDSLRALYGTNKKIIRQYELQILLALSHYPELKEIPIHFYEQEALLPLASRPEPLSVFGRKLNWQYNVIISTKSLESFEPILVKNLPFNAQVGIIGHELAHTTYYLDKSVWEMVSIGFNYPFSKFRAEFEKNTDRRAIAHGLGWQLLDYAEYARKVMSYETTVLGSEFYLSPQDIQAQIEKTY